MPLTSTLIPTIPLAIWLYLFFARGSFWQLREDTIEPEPLPRWPSVVAIVPARNEAETIARSVTSLVHQDYPGEFSIVVVDDQSCDGTADLARKAAQDSSAGGRVTVQLPEKLPPGWAGKVWAMNEGIAAARGRAADYFWFADAEFRAEKHSLDMASLMALLEAKTFPERLLIPPFLYFFLMLYPPNWVADPKAYTAGAAGGCILLRRTALERIGGMEALGSEVIDDCALARAVKRKGRKIWLGVTRSSMSLRGSGSFAEIRDMIARTAFTELRYSFFLLIATLIALFATYILPLISFFEGEGPGWFLAATAICLMAVSYGVTVRFYNLRFFWALTLTLAATFYAYATCVSAVRYWLGRGGQWKGRSQTPQKT
ncbi:MAG: glycosyl transferase family 2 [Acidobacteria bacterium]|nr:MAG: glycosyl transferase family 2 [Acidobacteriota bacterium]